MAPDSSKELGDTEQRNLFLRAQNLGIEVAVLDAREEGIGPLQAFCAEFPDMVTAFCREVCFFPEDDLRKRLADIKDHPNFLVQSSILRKTLGRHTIGFDSLRRSARNWLRDSLRSSQESMMAFSQDIGLLDESRQAPLSREGISTSLWGWWENGDRHEWRCAVLGEEGTGKTWAVMSWLLELAETSSSPIIIPVTSGQVPHSDDLGELLCSILSKRYGRSALFWKRRIDRWRVGQTDTPQILLCMDGLNEAPKAGWRQLIEQTKCDEWKGRIAMLATCRPDFWKRLYFPGCCNMIPTEGYDDHEIEQVLLQAGRHLQDVPQALRSLIRRPRYCDLVLQHFEMMAEDPTVERLLYEDYRNRLVKKLNHPVTPDDFRQILASLAEEYRDGVTSFRHHQVAQLVTGSEVDASIQEIIDGGLLVETGLTSTPFRVERRRLIHGLGMLLADHLSAAGNCTVSEHLESVGAWLEPGSEMELKAPVVGAAIFFATIGSSYPSAARRALLEYWLCRRNIPDDEEDILTAYIPECPEDILAVADACWGEKVDNQVAEERLTRAILIRRDHPKVKPALIDATKRWMSYVNIGGYPSRADIHGDAREKAIAAIREKVGRNICPGEEFQFYRWSFQAIDDDIKLFLSHLALKVISYGDRLPFVEALLNWAISRSIIGSHFEEEEVAWALRLTDEPVWEVLKCDVEAMAKSTDHVLRDAANTLLWCLGSNDCEQIRDQFLHDLYPKPQWLLEHEMDPCKGIFSIGRDRYQECLMRDDLPIKGILQKLGNYISCPEFQASQSFLDRMIGESYRLPMHAFCRHPMGQTVEEAEIDTFIDVAARFLPRLVGDFLRSVVHDISNRNEEFQSYLLSELPKISMLLKKEDIPVLRTAITGIRSSIDVDLPVKKLKRSEVNATLALLYHLSPDDVIHEILSRPNEASDALDLLIYCHEVSPDLARHLRNQLLSQTDTRYLQRLLWILPVVTNDQLTQDQEAKLHDFLSGDYGELRFGAMRYAYCSGNSALIESVLLKGAPYYSSISPHVNSYGAAILSEYGRDFPIDSLAERLSLPDLIRAVKIRGSMTEEVNLLVRLFGAILSSHTGPPFEDDADPVVLNISQRENYSLWAIRIDSEMMLTICQSHPDVVNSWSAWGLGGDSYFIHLFPGFYHSLCETLLKEDLEYGLFVELGG